MLKTQYPTDYLEKEGVNSEIAKPVEYRQHTAWQQFRIDRKTPGVTHFLKSKQGGANKDIDMVINSQLW